jgi:hypothetical protein
MSSSDREPILRYLATHAAMLGREHAAALAEPGHPDKYVRALALLGELVRGLPEDDERLLSLATLGVRDGQFNPGPATQHALGQFVGSSVAECDAFLTRLECRSRATTLWHGRALTVVCRLDALAEGTCRRMQCGDRDAAPSPGVMETTCREVAKSSDSLKTAGTDNDSDPVRQAVELR